MNENSISLPRSAQEVTMGTVVSQYPIEKYRVSENAVDLMTILTLNPVVTKTMYHDKVGFRFHELDAALGLGLQSSIHYNFLAALWNGSKDGRMLIDNRYTIVLLSLPKKSYERLVKKYELNGDLRKLVLQVYLDGEVKYQVMNFEVDNTKKPPYMTDKGLFDQIKEEVAACRPYIAQVVGSEIDEKRFWELWNTEGTAVEHYNPNEQQFRGRGMVGGSKPSNQLGAQVQQAAFRDAPQQRQVGALSGDDFNFSDAEDVTYQQNSGQPQNYQQPGTQPQNYQKPGVHPGVHPGVQPGTSPVQQQTSANSVAAQANAVDKSQSFFNNDQDFNFEN